MKTPVAGVGTPYRVAAGVPETPETMQYVTSAPGYLLEHDCKTRTLITGHE